MRFIVGLLLAAMLGLFAGSEGSAQGRDTTVAQSLALVYARNDTDDLVTLHVDGQYQGQVDPHSWSTLGVTFGKHVFSWSVGTHSSTIRVDVTSSPFNWPVGR